MNNIKPLPRVPATNGKVNVKVIDKSGDRDAYIASHELSLLSLLAQKYPEKAIKFAEKSLLTSVNS